MPLRISRPPTTAVAPFVPVSIVDPDAGTRLEIELANACVVRLRGPLSRRLLRAAIKAAGQLAVASARQVLARTIEAVYSGDADPMTGRPPRSCRSRRPGGLSPRRGPCPRSAHRRAGPRGEWECRSRATTTGR